MKRESEYGTKVRLLRILLALMENPFGYTRRELADRYGVDIGTIRNDFNAMENAGLFVESDDKHRYSLKENQPFRQLKSLLHFSDEDQLLLAQVIDQIAPHSKRGQQLKKKLASLYDYKRLGHAYLRKPYLSKVDLLLGAEKNKRAVILKDYHSSNSNSREDRKVEPFHVSPPDDTLQAFDIEKKGIRHFRISRILRVKATDLEWQHEGHHNIMRTDPFRIVDNNQVMVHLRLGIGARNELLERFPQTRSYVLETEDEQVFDFQCSVNHKFYGLTNFILGYYHQHIEVISPDELREHLNQTIEKMKF